MTPRNDRPNYDELSDRALLLRTAQKVDDIVDMRCEPAADQRKNIFDRLGILEKEVSTALGKAAGIALSVSLGITLVGLLITSCS